jgi:hypothetical protein
MPAVEEFLERYNSRDWEGLAGCFSPNGFHRIGPYGDVIASSSDYIEFLRGIVPTLGPEYRLSTTRIVYADRAAVAELVEHFEVEGELRETPEAIVFDLDAAGLITNMHLYVQHPRDMPEAGGRSAMGQRDD